MLLVVPDALLREALQAMLLLRGHAALVAHSIEEGYRQLERHCRSGAAPGAVILDADDIRPAAETVARFRHLLPRSATVVTLVAADAFWHPDAERLARTGAVLLRKPFDVSSLQDLLPPVDVQDPTPAGAVP